MRTEWEVAIARARRKFREQFKKEAVRLVTVRGVLMAQAAREFLIHVNLTLLLYLPKLLHWPVEPA